MFKLRLIKKLIIFFLTLQNYLIRYNFLPVSEKQFEIQALAFEARK